MNTSGRETTPNLDIDNLVEEIEGLAKQEKRAIASYLQLICEHLLKISYRQSEPDRCAGGWQREINNFRAEIEAILEDSPSLQNYPQSVLVREYLKASGITPQTVPEQNPFTNDYFG